MKFSKIMTDSGNKSSLTTASEVSGGSKNEYNTNFTHSSKDLLKGRADDKFGTNSQSSGSGSGSGIDKGFKS